MVHLPYRNKIHPPNNCVPEDVPNQGAYIISLSSWSCYCFLICNILKTDDSISLISIATILLISIQCFSISSHLQQIKPSLIITIMCIFIVTFHQFQVIFLYCLTQVTHRMLYFKTCRQSTMDF